MDRKALGAGMALLGFIFLIINGIQYLKGNGTLQQALLPIGIVLVMAGLVLLKKLAKKKKGKSSLYYSPSKYLILNDY